MQRLRTVLWALCALVCLGHTLPARAQEATNAAADAAPAPTDAVPADPALSNPALSNPAPSDNDVQALFDRATDIMAAGDHRAAAEALVELADRAPDAALADDALFAAAKLYEEHLAEPTRARDLYARLLREHPESRTALAAQRRVQTINAGLGPNDSGAQALSRFTELLQHFTERGEDTSIAMAETLLQDYPTWSGRSRVLTWLGDVRLRANRGHEALAYYTAAAEAAAPGAPGDDQRLAAYRGAGDAALLLGRFDDAERYFRMMPTAGDSSRMRALEDALERVATRRTRTTLYRLSFVVLGLVVLLLCALLRTAVSSWREFARALRAPPTEVLFMVPIAGLFIAASTTAHYAIAPAVTIICIGGLVVTWLSGAGLVAARANHLGAARSLLHMALTTAAVLALSYIALHHNRLIDMVLDTVRFGPDV